MYHFDEEEFKRLFDALSIEDKLCLIDFLRSLVEAEKKKEAQN